jgi:histidine triad (HIT) family protein
MNDTCIFCKIISGNIPSTKIYEDGQFFGFLDIHPVTKGHVLLIPKAHYGWMHDTPDELVGDAFVTTKKLMNTIRTNLPCDYVQISVVGKDIPHFHIHLIPRFFNDNLPQFPTTTYESEVGMNAVASRIKNTL